MKTLLIIDVETTGTDRENDRVCEVGAALYSVEHDSVLYSLSSLIAVDDNPAEHVNRIPAAATQVLGRPMSWALSVLRKMAASADAVVAHNAPFDHAFVGDLGLRWVDSLHYRWPKPSASKRLSDIAAAHRIGTSGAHSALIDCQTLVALFGVARDCGQDVSAELEHAARPRPLYWLKTPFEMKDACKELGARWDAEARQWRIRMLPEEAAALAEDWGYPVVEVAPGFTGLSEGAEAAE